MVREAPSKSEPIIYVNGRFHRKSEARISPMDHGILYGDGVFDTCGALDGMIWGLEEHIERFFKSAKAVDMAIPVTRENLRKAVLETVRRNGLKDAYIKMYCTRGDGLPFIDPEWTTGPTLVIFAVPPAPSYSEDQRKKGARAIISSIRRIPPACGVEARIKQLNYMNNVLMLLEAKNAGADLAIALDMYGYVTEGVGQNIFIVKDSVICTPPVQIVLEGITRRSVISIGRKMGFRVMEEMLTPYDLFIADEIFVTATAAAGGGGIVAVTNVNGRTIGGGKTGPVTGRLINAYSLAMKRDKRHLTPIQ